MLFDGAVKEAEQGPPSPVAEQGSQPDEGEEEEEEALDGAPLVANAEQPSRTVTQDAYDLFDDLCRLTAGDTATWLRIDTISQIFGLELLESVLSAHAHFFETTPIFLKLVKDRACPLVIKSFKDGSSFPLILRIVRLMDCVVTNFSSSLVVECEVFISRMTRMLKVENPLWLHTTVLEVFQMYCNNPRLLRKIFLNYDQQDSKDDEAKILRNVVSAIAHFVQSMFDWSTISKEGNGRYQRLLEQLYLVEPPSVAAGYVVHVATETLAGVAKSCAILASSNALAPGRSAQDPETDVLVAKSVLNTSWPPILAGLSTLFSKSVKETEVQTVLATFFSLTKTSCELGLESPRDAFLTAISHAAFPSVLQQHDSGASPSIVAASAAAVLNNLKMRNILAMQLLLKVAEQMGNELGSGWMLVLRNASWLWSLVRTPLPPERGYQARISEEFGALDKELSSLFSYTFALSDDAVKELLRSLCAVHAEDAASAALSPSTTNEERFALSKIVEVMSVNVHRIESLWEILLEHLRAISSSHEATVREVAVQALARVISAAFSFQSDRFDSYRAQLEEAPTDMEQDIDSMLYMQNRFLEALEEFSRSNFSDVRHKTLETLYQVLQASGQIVTHCWPVVLSMLMTVAVNNDKPQISDGFSSVTLVCTDFLPNLPLDCLALFTTTIGCYGLQSSDINISLTAIGLLFTIADFLGKGKASPAMERVDSSPSSNSYAKPAVSTPIEPKQLDRLWLSLFTELKQLATDQRFEVRSCALRTLFKTVTTHGSILPDSTWQDFVWQIVAPMMAEISSSSSAAAADEFDVELGKQGGKTVKLMVHHSRNNAQKQWADTQVLSYGGLANMLRTFYGRLARLDRFQELWDMVVGLGVTMGSSHTREIAENSITALQGLWLGLALQDAYPLPRSSWRALAEAFHAIAANMAAAQVPTQEQVLTCMAQATLALYEGMRTQFEDEDVAMLLRILQALATAPSDAPLRRGMLGPVQQRVLECFSSLPPVSERIFLEIIGQLLAMAVAPTRSRGEGSSQSSAEDEKTRLQRRLLSKEAIAVLVQLFSTKAPPRIRYLSLGNVATVLAEVMSLKYLPEAPDLWKDAARAFVGVIRAALEAPTEEITAAIGEDTWAALADGVEGFLFFERSEEDKLSHEQLKEEAEHDVALVNHCISYLFPVGNIIPVEILERMIAVLDRGSREKGRRPEFGEQCYSGLFAVVEKGNIADETPLSCNMDLAQLAVPVLMKRVHDALTRFIEGDQMAGNLPLARQELDQMVLMLTQLKELSLPPSLRVFKATSSASEAFQKSTKRHLLFVFPLLCDCITTKEDSIKEMLKEIFHLAAREVGLE